MELRRRANDKRVAAVYAAIIDMLSVLFEYVISIRLKYEHHQLILKI